MQPLSIRNHVFVWFVVTTLLLFAFIAHAAIRPATEADKAAIEAAGITYRAGMSWDPDNQYAGDEVAIATQFLLERNGSGSRDTYCYKSKTDRITRMNPQFRISLYKALTEMEKQFGGKNIIQSGFRCAGSTHGSGCAADIIWTSCSRQYPGNTERAWRCSSDHYDKSTNTWSQPEQKWIDANGKNYGIHLRLRFGPEGHHVEPVNTRGCVTGATVANGNAPSSGISNAVRSLVNPQPSPQPQTPSQPLAQSQQPQLQKQPELGTENKTAYAPGTCPPQFYCTNDTYYYRASTCVDQVQKKCAAGCAKAGTTCAATSTRETSSPFGEIENIAEPAPADVGAVSDQLLELSIRGEDVVTLKDTSATATSALDTPNGSPTLSEQTFVSSDLRYSPSNQYPSQEISAMQRVLAMMKDVLMRALLYLRPFGTSQHLGPYETIEDEEYQY